MSIQNLVTKTTAVAAVAAMLSAASAPAFALTVPGGAAQPSFAVGSPIEKVWCQWGCGPGPVVGGFVAGAIVGAAVAGAARPAYPPGYYTYGPGYYYGPCWQRWIGPYGGVHWRRVC
jgi:hypothetical protein